MVLFLGYDQVLSGDIEIKKRNKHSYKIIFNKISKVLVYQTWSDISNDLNKKRNCSYQKAKYWILNNFSDNSFQPTTVMEIDNKKYIFVITNAKFKNGHATFYVSTKEINLKNKNIKRLKKLPEGQFKSVRFDIDDNLYYVPCPLPNLEQANSIIGNQSFRISGYATVYPSYPATITVNNVIWTGYSFTGSGYYKSFPFYLIGSVSNNTLTVYISRYSNQTPEQSYEIQVSCIGSS
jgi:hypothetical protein